MSVDPVIRAEPHGPRHRPARHRHPFRPRLERVLRRVVVRVEGELDACGEPRFESTLETAARTGDLVVLDLSGTRFLAVRCAATILAAHDRAARRGVAIRVVAGERGVERALELAGVRARCHRYPSVAAALAD